MRRKADRLGVAALAISLIVAVVVGAFGYPALLDVNRLSQENRALSERIVRESDDRRDQSCRRDEADHEADVKRLRRTYAFLARLPREDWGTNLTRAIVRQLPELEREARVDAAPPFCDAPGVGLPEPDPKLPMRRAFGHLLQRP